MRTKNVGDATKKLEMPVGKIVALLRYDVAANYEDFKRILERCEVFVRTKKVFNGSINKVLDLLIKDDNLTMEEARSLSMHRES